MIKPGSFRWSVYVLFFLSGCAALIYEVVWTRQLTLVLGGTTYAITTVVASFMAGLGLGSFIGGRLGDRLGRPGRSYAILEILIGAYALLVPVLMGAAEPLYRLLYPHLVDYPWLLMAARFGVSALILIIPTTLMGATLPLLVSYVIRGGYGLGRSTGWLYGINTFGAMLGAMLAGFWLIPALGITRTTWLTAGMNIAIGVLGWFLLKGLSATSAASAAPRPGAAPLKKPVKPKLVVEDELPGGVILAVACVSGLAAMIYQIAWTRALIMSLGSSTYSFTCILSAFIMGLGLGSLLISWVADRLQRPVVTLAMLEWGIGLSALLILPIHGLIPRWVASLVVQHHERYGMLLALEFGLIMAVTLVPTLLMGAAFPLITRLVGKDRKDPARAVGRVYSINTIGSITGALLGGFVLIRSEVLGIQDSIVAAALINMLAGSLLLIRRKPIRWTRPQVVGANCTVLLIVVGAVTAYGKWDVNQMVSGPFMLRQESAPFSGEVIYFSEDVEITVAVSREGDDSLNLTVNGKVDASLNSLDVRTQLLLGHLPALLDSDGKRACVIGLGSGMTLGAIAKYPSYVQLDCIEISSAVIKAAAFFAPYCNHVLTADPRVRQIRADGRNHLLLNDRQYDLIVSEPSNPWMAGVASLFTREFFQIARQRLTPEGQLAVWIHSYSMSIDDFKMVVHTLAGVFEDVSIWELAKSDYCLIARKSPSKLTVRDVMQRYAHPEVRADLYRAGIHDLGGVLGAYVAGGQRLRDWAATDKVNTDDNSLLEFSAPRAYYRDDSWTIAKEINKLQESPLGQLMACDLDDRGAEHLRQRVAAVVDARMSLVNGLMEWLDADYARAMQTMLGGYQRDPGNVLLACLGIAEIRNVAETGGIPTITQEMYDRWTAQVDHVLKPFHISVRAATVPLAIDELERTALQHHQAGDHATAAMFLSQAYDLAPNNSRVAGTLGLALIRAQQLDRAEAVLNDYLERHPGDGWANYAASHLAIRRSQYDQCLDRLAVVLKSGVFTAEQVKNDPNFAPLREDERFATLLRQDGRLAEPTEQ